MIDGYYRGKRDGLLRRLAVRVGVWMLGKTRFGRDLAAYAEARERWWRDQMVSALKLDPRYFTEVRWPDEDPSLTIGPKSNKET